MAIQLRPCTPYMMKLRPLSLNRNRLSPSKASAALAMAARLCASAAAPVPWLGVAGPAAPCGGAAKRISCSPPSSDQATIITPAVARRKRGASASSRNCHHSSMPVLDMPVAEKAQPRRAQRGQPGSRAAKGRRSAAASRRLLAVECPRATAGAPPGPARDRAPPPSRAPFAQREHDAGRQDARRCPPGGVQAPAQAQSDSPGAPGPQGCRRNATARSAASGATGASHSSRSGTVRRGA